MGVFSAYGDSIAYFRVSREERQALSVLARRLAQSRKDNNATVQPKDTTHD